jgi:hypothetical protein
MKGNIVYRETTLMPIPLAVAAVRVADWTA